MIKVGLIGLGRFALNYINTINNLDDVYITYICSKSLKGLDCLGKAKLKKGQTKPIFTTDYKEVCKSDIDAVIIVTPPNTHFDICCSAIANNKHVICEKPFVFSSVEALKIKKMINSKDLTFFINYIHLWNSNYTKYKQIYTKGQPFGVINTVGMGNGPIREYSSLWDYGSHDIAMCLDFLDETPIAVKSFFYNGLNNENQYFIQLKFLNGETWSLVSNASFQKVRNFSCKELGFFVDNTSKEQPLTLMIKDFCNSINLKLNKKNINLGVNVTKVLEECEKQS